MSFFIINVLFLLAFCPVKKKSRYHSPDFVLVGSCLHEFSNKYWTNLCSSVARVSDFQSSGFRFEPK